MTGYGTAETDFGGKKIVVELRSLNSKQLDLSIKLPPAYRLLEADLRLLLQQRIQRGKVDLQMSCKLSGTAPVQALNEKMFAFYWAKLQGIESALETSLHIRAADIVGLPDVVAAPDTPADEQEKTAVLGCCAKAVDALCEFRAREGKMLITDILQRMRLIQDLLGQTQIFENERADSVRAKLKQSLESAVDAARIDPNRFEQELIYYLEKLDITEERTRLAEHCRYFAQTADEAGAGRKLGFIAQEMGREINTLGAKANHSGIQRIVVQMKDELEKMKEQLFNIL